MITLSASSLSRAEKCPASCSLPRVARLHADAEAGTEAHLEHEAACPPGERAEVAYAYDVERGTARELPSKGHRDYRDLREGEIPGTVDRVRVALPVVYIDDFKSGFGYLQAAPQENLQLLHNALCAASAAGADSAVVSLSGPDGPKGPPATLDAFDLAAGRERIRAIWRAAHAPSPRVVAGEHCWRCECMAYCPAYREVLCAVGSGVVNLILPTGPITAELISETWPMRNLARRALAMYDAAVEGWVQSNGPAPLADGRTLALVAGTREELDGQTAYQTIRDLHGEATAKEAVEMSATKASIERALAKVAPPRGKSKLVKAALDAIRARDGASTKATKPKLEAIRADTPALPAKTEAA